MADEVSVKVNLSAFRETADGLFKKNLEVLRTMDELSEWNSVEKAIDNIGKLMDMILGAVAAAEVAAQKVDGVVSGREKLDAAVKMIDDAIQLPWYAEMFDEIVIRILISQAVEMLNRFIGKKWDIAKVTQWLETGRGWVESAAKAVVAADAAVDAVAQK